MVQPDGTVADPDGTVAVLGEPALIRGYALAGARPLAAETPGEIHDRWASLPRDVRVVVLTPAAAAALDRSGAGTSGPMTVVMPP